MTRLIIIALCLGLLFSCKKKLEHVDIKTLIVADHRIDCQGEFVTKCFLIKGEINQPWRLFSGVIEAFQYEEGFEYEIEVEQEDYEFPITDGPSFKYVLRRVISKK